MITWILILYLVPLMVCLGMEWGSFEGDSFEEFLKNSFAPSFVPVVNLLVVIFFVGYLILELSILVFETIMENRVKK